MASGTFMFVFTHEFVDRKAIFKVLEATGLENGANIDGEENESFFDIYTDPGII